MTHSIPVHSQAPDAAPIPAGGAAPDPAESRLLHSYQEARELLGGVPRSTFALWIAQGLLSPVRIGPRRCFVRHADLLRLAQGGACERGA